MQVSQILKLKGSEIVALSGADSLLQAVALMSTRDIGSLLVMDGNEMRGLVTFREIISALHRYSGDIGNVLVEQVMVKDPLTCDPDDSIDALRRNMLSTHSRYVPVLRGGALLGVISFHDVAKAVLDRQDFENRMLKGYIKNWPEAQG
jgi:CBS domain-containing protein